MDFHTAALKSSPSRNLLSEFSLSVQILLHLSTQNLMLLAELKMYLHEEHVHAGSSRKCLKKYYCQDTTEANPTEADTDAFAVKDEESFTTSKIMEAATNPLDFQQIPIKDLFDFSCTQDWLESFYQIAIPGLDVEVELYELLDLDANGIDNPEFPQADEILDK
ncbi:hypothetical protein BDR04DRAFT_1115882 [Suillus decipiens]|nr:hypothetical protein BDR04DRAFT_1115882 [Suillus decipiens]